ncbi:hypothetical protein CPJCM30710_02060 [Clostridium polyendosporum]|uniref:Uncharacterized protein n=1 Tax=Clostridium polyendosporum TaxID=69208 RepID=A0A919VEL1_9CLOT|nr:hypothetical protein [Clostridium polyendosporum]GIM27540.1 hypothetical protein CPJCM30710_02060 [Clostridium polyendosporum]
MNKLFSISGVVFYSEDFQDNINEYSDLITIIQDVENKLHLEEIQCVDPNDCCEKTKMNLFSEIVGYVNQEDEFFLQDELEGIKDKNNQLELFVIRIYKCLSCGKWLIDILE